MRGKAQRVDRPAQTRLQNKGYWTPKFTKRLPNVEDSSAVLTKKWSVSLPDVESLN